MKKNRFIARMLIFVLLTVTLCTGLAGCTRELTETQSTALVALQNAVTYYESNNNLSHWEEIVALAAANQADGIGVNWSALTLVPSLGFPDAPALDVSTCSGSIFTAILYGEDYATSAQSLAQVQNPETGSFEDNYINQHVWAMIALNAALGQSGYDYDKAVSYLLTFQNEDGGFAYTRRAVPENTDPENAGSGSADSVGTDAEETNSTDTATDETVSTEEIKSDVDLSGIAAIALAPYYESHKRSPEIKALISYFTAAQTESGGYEGFGGENPSTISSAIWGITALNQPLPAAEPDGLTPVDALLAYQNEDGSFRATKDGEHVFDSYSTRQAMIALSDIINKAETYNLMSADAENYRIEHISGPTISFMIDFPEESGVADVETTLRVAENSTALDAILLYGKLKEIPVTYSGGGTSAYIESIDNVSEKDYGETSGWVYRLNHEALPQGAGSATLQEGDRLEWVYVTDVNHITEQ